MYLYHLASYRLFSLCHSGTKDGFLSDSVRLYQALDRADVPVKLDIYEVFFHNTTESDLAISKTSDFLREYLDH